MSYVGSISHSIQVEGPSWPDICEHVQVTSRCLVVLSLFLQCFFSVCIVGVWERFKRGELAKIWWLFFGMCLRSQFTYLLLRTTKIALTRRKCFKTAWDAGKQQTIQQSNKVSRFYLKLTFFLSFKKNRLHPMQAFVNNHLQHNTARKQESRPRSCNELGLPVV